jgi:hypothetical protein
MRDCCVAPLARTVDTVLRGAPCILAFRTATRFVQDYEIGSTITGLKTLLGFLAAISIKAFEREGVLPKLKQISAVSLLPDVHIQFESLARVQVGVAPYAVPSDEVIDRYLESRRDTMQ